MKIIYYYFKLVKLILVLSFVISIGVSLLITVTGVQHPDNDTVYRFLNLNAMSIMPLIYSLPCICIAYNLVDLDGAELHYIGSKIKILSFLIAFMGSMALMTVPFGIIVIYAKQLALWLYFKSTIILFLFISMIYLTTYLVKNIEIPIVVCVIMAILGIVILNNGSSLLYITNEIQTGIDFFQSNLSTLIIAVVMYLIGVVVNYKCQF